jgi:hypothetical protein
MAEKILVAGHNNNMGIASFRLNARISRRGKKESTRSYGIESFCLSTQKPIPNDGYLDFGRRLPAAGRDFGFRNIPNAKSSQDMSSLRMSAEDI